MDDLISRQAVLDMLEDINNHVIDGYGYRHDWCVEWVKGLPTIDAVPVVRCKDCIHSTSQVSDDEDNYYCNAMRRCMHSLDFCSYAERKE